MTILGCLAAKLGRNLYRHAKANHGKTPFDLEQESPNSTRRGSNFSSSTSLKKPAIHKSNSGRSGEN